MAKAGKYRLRVTFYAPNLGRDTSTGELLPRTAFATVWAGLTPNNATYKEKSEQVTTETTWKLEIRYLAGLDTSFTVNYDGRTFKIMSIQDPTGQKRELKLILIERNSGRG